jgi:hypothetical protein
MNPRHAAAIALMGWYLMVPYRPDDPTEPISQWYQSGSFDTAAQCRTLLEWEMSDDYAKQAEGTPNQIREYQRNLKGAKRISTDDPRLKEK